MFNEKLVYYSQKYLKNNIISKNKNNMNNTAYNDPFIEFSFHYDWKSYNDSLNISKYINTINKEK
ncbi:hypothetical protein [Staphylococcus succinus]|uniref:Uncharacterized protein n=1 Tax=Staphylococcus succinus TaxID=61015 RepID=A0ABX5INP2_9STAP|nr:hypothetical protein [Staphylococcus succinus]PTI69085.1 hypothetical protein BU057_06500 [Staphylococcus succinus]